VKRIAFISPQIGYPPVGGPWRRSYLNFLALTKIAKVDLYLFDSISQLNTIDERGVDHFRNIAHSIHVIDRRDGFSQGQLLGMALQNSNADLVWLCYAGVMWDWIPDIKELNPEKKIIADTDSVYSDYILRELSHVKNLKKKWRIWRKGRSKRREENKFGKMVHGVTAVSDTDKLIYDRWYGGSPPVSLLYNVIDVKSYFPHNNSDISPIEGPKICFTATMCTAAHEDAVLWLVHRVMPWVWERMPQMKLYLVGRDPTAKIKSCADERVIVTGMVESVLPYLFDSVAALVPLRFESGTRSKIVEAFAARVPVVSTTLGYEGMPLRSGEHLLEANSPLEMADAIETLNGDQNFRKALIENGLKFALDNYDLNCGQNQINKIVKKVLSI